MQQYYDLLSKLMPNMDVQGFIQDFIANDSIANNDPTMFDNAYKLGIGGRSTAMESLVPGMQSAIGGLQDLSNTSSGFADQLSGAASGAYGVGAPVNEAVGQDLLSFLRGGGTPDSLGPVREAGKLGAERALASAQENLMGSTPNGGARTAAMTDLYNDYGQNMANLDATTAQNLFNQAFTFGQNALPQYSSAMGQAGNINAQAGNMLSEALQGFGTAANTLQGSGQLLSSAGYLANADTQNALNLYGTNLSSAIQGMNLNVNQKNALLSAIMGQPLTQTQAAGSGTNWGGLGGSLGSILGMGTSDTLLGSVLGLF